MSEVSLLPPNAGAVMRALSEAFAPAAELPHLDFAALWDPWNAPADRLPSLAAELGVMLWRSEWPEARKRQVIARAIDLRRKRGTRKAFDAYLGFVDAELVSLRTAPQTTTPRRSKTQEERDAWAAQFPELRIYVYRHRHGGRALTVGQPWGGVRRAVRSSIAPGHAGRRATIIREGGETTIALRVFEGSSEFVQHYLRATLPKKGRRFVAGRPLSVPPRSSTADDRTYQFRNGERPLPTLPPGATPIDIQPKRIAARAVRPSGMTVGRCLAGPRRTPRHSRAAERIYDSFRLYDPTIAGRGSTRRPGGWYAGSSRLGQRPFEINLEVDLARKAPGRRRFPFSPGGVVRSHDGRPSADVYAAIRAAKLGRDRVLVRTNVHRPIQAGDAIPLDGSYRLGQIVRNH